MKYFKKENFKNSANFFLTAILFAIPLGTRWIVDIGEYGEHSTITLYFFDLLLFVFIALYFYVHTNFVQEVIDKQRVLFLLLIGLDTFLFIGILRASDFWVAATHYFWFLCGISLFLIIAFGEQKKQPVILGLILAGVAQAVWASWQFALQAIPGNKWLGVAEHDPINLGVSVVESTTKRILRAYGGFDHPNILGGFLVLIMFIFIYYFIVEEKIKISKIISYSTVAVFTFGVFVSFSRAAWISGILGLCVYSIILLIQKQKQLYTKIVQVIIVVSLVAGFCVWMFWPFVNARVNGDSRLEVQSMQTRFSALNNAREIIVNNFWFGVGLGGYVPSLSRYNNNTKPYWTYQPPHNTFVLVFAEIGLFGFLFFIILFFYLPWSVLNKNSNNSSGAFVLTLFTCLATLMFFDHWWWNFHFGVLFFWAILGIIMMFVKKD